MKQRFGNYLIDPGGGDDDGGSRRANVKDFVYSSTKTNQLRDSFGTSYKNRKQSNEFFDDGTIDSSIEEIAPPLPMQGNPSRSLKRHQKRKQKDRVMGGSLRRPVNKNAWAIDESEVETDRSLTRDLLYTGNSEVSPPPARKRPQSARPTSTKARVEHRKLRPQSAKSPVRTSKRPQSGRPKSARPQSARPQSARPVKRGSTEGSNRPHSSPSRRASARKNANLANTFRPTSAPISRPRNSVNPHLATLHILEKETSKLFRTLNIGSPIHGSAARSLRRKKRAASSTTAKVAAGQSETAEIVSEQNTSVMGATAGTLSMTAFNTTVGNPLSPVGSSPPGSPARDVLLRAASPLLSESEINQTPYRWVGESIVILGPWSDFSGAITAEVVGYIARNGGAYVVQVNDLFEHPDSFPTDPNSPTCPEPSDAIRIGHKLLLEGVELHRMKERGMRP